MTWRDGLGHILGAEVSTGGSGLRRNKPRSVSQEANTLGPAGCHYGGQGLNLANKGSKKKKKSTPSICPAFPRGKHRRSEATHKANVPPSREDFSSRFKFKLTGNVQIRGWRITKAGPKATISQVIPDSTGQMTWLLQQVNCKEKQWYKEILPYFMPFHGKRNLQDKLMNYNMLVLSRSDSNKKNLKH